MTSQERKTRIVLALSARAGEILSALEPAPPPEDAPKTDKATRVLFAMLLECAPEEREAIAVANRRFHHQPLCRLLLDHAYAQLPADTNAAHHFSELALAILDAMWPPVREPVETHRDLVSLAHAQFGYVAALATRWNEAHTRFDTAFAWLEKGSEESAITARIHRMYRDIWQKHEEKAAAALAISTPNPNLDMAALRRAERQRAVEERKGKQLLAEILQLDPQIRHTEVLRLRRFQSQALCRQLLDYAHAQVLTDLNASRALSELALAILDAIWPPSNYPLALHRDLRALAHAQMANVLSLQSQLNEARRHYDLAYKSLDAGSGDLAIHARINRLYAVFWMDQGNLQRCGTYLHRALRDLEMLDDDHGTGMTLLYLSALQRLEERPRAALKTYFRACALIDEKKAPLLAASAWINLAVLLCEMQDFEQAARAIEGLPSEIEEVRESIARLNLVWVKGRIAHGLKDYPAAIRYLEETRDGFKSQGNLMDYALVALDLLRAHADQGDFASVAATGKAVYEALSALPLPKETRECFELLTRATRQHQRVDDALTYLSTHLPSHSCMPQ